MMPTLGGSVRRKLLVIAGGVVTLVAVVVGGAAPAEAHAELVETRPANGAVLGAPPTEIHLRFSETVNIPDRALEVFGASGDELDIGEPVHVDGDGSTLGVELPALDEGAYVVTWRVGSADSHPIRGAFTFRIGEGSQEEANALMARLVASSGGDTTVGLLYGVDRFAGFAGMVLLVGGALLVAGLWPAGAADRRVRRLVAGGWITVVVTTVLAFGLQAAYTAGEDLGGVVDPSVVGDVFGTRAGRVWLVRLLLLVVVVLLRDKLLPGWSSSSSSPSPSPSSPPVAGGGPAPATSLSAAASVEVDAGDAGGSAASATGRAGPAALELGPAAAERFTPPVVGVLVFGLALLATISLAGHAGAGDLVVLAMVTDLVHLLSVSFWLGGLVLLLLVVLRLPPVPAGAGAGAGAGEGEGDRTGGGTAAAAPRASGAARRVVAEFSALALVAVGAIVVSGTVQGWRQVGSVDALTGTTYGRLLIAKVALFAMVMVGAYVSRSAVRRRAAEAGPTVGVLRRSVGAEVVIALVVLGVTALLVNTVPAEDAYDPTFSAETHGVALLVRVEIDPAKAGPADLGIETLDHGGAPIEVPEVAASLSQPGRDIAALPVELEPGDGTGRYVAEGVELPFPGAWQLDVDVRLSEFDQETISFTVPVK
jgi:copper transport protein